MGKDEKEWREIGRMKKKKKYHHCNFVEFSNRHGFLPFFNLDEASADGIEGVVIAVESDITVSVAISQVELDRTDLVPAVAHAEPSPL
jgi:hypothetical protein